MKPFTPDFWDLGDATVAGLLDQSTGGWNVPLIRILFWDNDCDAILQIPVVGNGASDIRVWQYMKHGNCAVRSGYHLDRRLKACRLDNRLGQTSNLNRSNWGWIWNLKIPNKIKKFIWRLLRNSLPTLDILRSRGVHTSIMCPVCKDKDESLIHVFKDCAYARLFWACSPFPSMLSNAGCVDIYDWIMQLKHKSKIVELELFLCSLWSIWSNRNQVVHENKSYDSREAVEFIAQYLVRFREAQHKLSSPRPPEAPVHWKPPPAGFYKLNFDAAVRNSPQGICIAAVARDSDGQVIAWARKKISHIQIVEVAESLAAQEAMKLATEFNFRRIILEGDCFGVIQQLQQVEPSLSVAGGIITDIKTLGC